MQIRLDDASLYAALLQCLRGEGCIAYYDHEKGAIEAILPHLFGTQEAEAISSLVARWQSDLPDTQVEMRD